MRSMRSSAVKARSLESDSPAVRRLSNRWAKEGYFVLVGLLTSELTAPKRINDPKAKHEDYGHFAMVAHRQIPILGTPVNRDSGPPSGATLTAIEDNALEKA
jgi:hypothetical protein